MWLLLRQIPKGTRCNELGKFVAKGVQPSWMFFPLQSHSVLKRCEILQIFDPDTQTTEHHGLIQLDSRKSALPVIKRLNGRKLQGVAIEVRKYVRRSSFRDRRRILPERENQRELRRQDRRRDRLRSRVLHAPEVERVLCIL
jgi:hypothetical protein